MLRFLIIFTLLFASIMTIIAQDDDPEEIEIQTPPTLTMTLSMFLLVDDIDNPDPDVSTVRTEDDMQIIHEKMNDIWSQANIELDLQHIGYLEVPKDVLEDILDGQFQSFFIAVGEGEIPIDNVSQINGFYSKHIGGPNGIMLNSQVYFVNDEPTVNDERVSSHEVGHILGLHHHLFDPNQLMYSGTNGTNLNEVEITVARYFATGFSQGVRR